ncbi:hypothetical protein ACFYKX_07915 [Cytobacillus sp. FJAT-54145]|uniref:DUF5348 domain-containing protein n=1 Tax=Cytobacillus spartinae TaxID=3299023 RepID=A0ABW6K8R6_9BACI
MSLAHKLNEVFTIGDKLEVLSGAEKLFCEGIFLSVEDEFLVWANEEGDVLFTQLDGVTIKKL